MAKQLQLRRGTTAEIAAFTGAVGEPTYDTTTKTVQIHDGATAGGLNVSRVLVTNVAPGVAQVAGEVVHINYATRAVYVWSGSAWVTIISPP